uniref:Uncharacterized protein n=1 Tax=Fagus sylvatica TaxID=28930 RepID=A0A2N9FRA5_FAGSY
MATPPSGLFPSSATVARGGLGSGGSGLGVTPWRRWWRRGGDDGDSAKDLARSHQIRRDLARSGEISPDLATNSSAQQKPKIDGGDRTSSARQKPKLDGGDRNSSARQKPKLDGGDRNSSARQKPKLDGGDRNSSARQKPKLDGGDRTSSARLKPNSTVEIGPRRRWSSQRRFPFVKPKRK